MKSDVMPSRVQMEPAVLQSLLTEVKETVAREFFESNSNATTTFRAVNLWKVQRNYKSAQGYYRRRTALNN